MTKRPYRTPLPRQPVASPDLSRPDWTKPEDRNPDRLWLDKNENSDPELAALVAKVFAETPPQVLFSYPDSARLYNKLAGYLGVSAENLILAAGSDGVIRSVFEAFVSQGDVVIHTDPTFAMYGVYSAMYGADVRKVVYHPSNRGPVLPLDEFLHLISTTSPRLVCLPNPDSPTGTVLAPDDMRTVIEAAGRAGSVVLIDEAYHPFYAETVVPWVNEYPHMVVARSTGKAWGMAGIRIGYGVATADLARMLHKVRPMYETSTVAVSIFERMLDHDDAMRRSVERLQRGKHLFLDAMRDLGFAVHEAHGNFLHVAFGARAELVHAALDGYVYYRKDFREPSLKGFSRFSATTPEKFAPIIERIRAALKGNT